MPASASSAPILNLVCFRSTLLLSVIVALGLAVSARANELAAGDDLDAACRIPFERLKDSKTGEPFPLSAALNDNDKLPMNVRQRYIVADLNSADKEGICRGVQEHFTRVDDLSEFPRLRAIAMSRNIDLIALAAENPQTVLASIEKSSDVAALALELELEDLKNYVDQVHRFKTDPINKVGVFSGYCVGQTLNFCEITDGKPKLVYRFVTSSSRWRPQVNAYYAPINYVANRNWSTDRRYTPADAKRDERMGGGRAHIAMFENGGNPIEMPNFLHFLPMPGYSGERANGIHQIAGGLDSGGTFGSPVSLGCIRLSRYAAKLARWWTPQQAKFFMYFDTEGYRNYGDVKTGKAKPFIMPPPLQTRAPERSDLFSLFAFRR